MLAGRALGPCRRVMRNAPMYNKWPKCSARQHGYWVEPTCQLSTQSVLTGRAEEALSCKCSRLSYSSCCSAQPPLYPISTMDMSFPFRPLAGVLLTAITCRHLQQFLLNAISRAKMMSFQTQTYGFYLVFVCSGIIVSIFNPAMISGM